MLQLYPDAELRESHTIDVLMGRLRKNPGRASARGDYHRARSGLPLRYLIPDALPAKPTALSLRARFLLATAAVVLVLSLSYGMVAVVGYIVSFDKTTYRVMRGESNLFYTLAQWKNNQLTIAQPEQLTLNRRRWCLSTTSAAACCGSSATCRRSARRSTDWLKSPILRNRHQ